MGLVQLITAILNLPSTIEAIWDRLAAIEAKFDKEAKAKLQTSIIETEKQTEAAQSDEDYKKASAANAADFHGM